MEGRSRNKLNHLPDEFTPIIDGRAVTRQVKPPPWWIYAVIKKPEADSKRFYSSPCLYGIKKAWGMIVSPSVYAVMKSNICWQIFRWVAMSKYNDIWRRNHLSTGFGLLHKARTPDVRIYYHAYVTWLNMSHLLVKFDT